MRYLKDLWNLMNVSDILFLGTIGILAIALILMGLLPLFVLLWDLNAR